MDAVQDNQNTTASTHYTKLSSGLNQHPPQTSRLQGHEEKDAQSLRLRVFHKTDWFLEIASAFLALLALLGMVSDFPLTLIPYLTCVLFYHVSQEAYPLCEFSNTNITFSR
jgi:hypothetical protein